MRRGQQPLSRRKQSQAGEVSDGLPVSEQGVHPTVGQDHPVSRGERGVGTVALDADQLAQAGGVLVQRVGNRPGKVPPAADVVGVADDVGGW